MILTVILGACLVAATSASSFAAIGSDNLGYNVYKEVAKTDAKNILISPFSAEIILALTSLGAAGQTYGEFVTTLGLHENKSAVADNFKQLTTALHGTTNVTLKIANKMFLAEGLTLEPDFKNSAVESFHSDIENIDFGKTEEAANNINGWASSHTNDKIKNIVKPNDLDGVLLCLINAVYFFGEWPEVFDVLPEPIDFHTTKTTSVKKEAFHFTGYYRYANVPELEASIMEIPYKDSDYVLMVALPNEIDGLSKLEAKFPLDLKKYENQLSHTRVHATVPKFKIEQTIQLKPILEKLGLNLAFLDTADFSGITKAAPLKISKVIQKTFIDVNEKGTEAAAVTAVLTVGYSALVEPPPVQFKVDRPFIFMLRQKSAAVNLFIGRHIK